MPSNVLWPSSTNSVDFLLKGVATQSELETLEADDGGFVENCQPLSADETDSQPFFPYMVHPVEASSQDDGRAVVHVISPLPKLPTGYHNLHEQELMSGRE